jgi:hypothetical protein
MLSPLSSLLFGAAIVPYYLISTVALPSLAPRNIAIDIASNVQKLESKSLYLFEQSHFTFDRLYALLKSSLFAEDVIGRLSVTRTSGRELNTEYISLLGVALSHHPIRFTSKLNIESVVELVFFNITLINQLVPVEVDTWFAFDLEGEIIEYDASLCWLAWVYLLDAFTQSLRHGNTDAGVVSEIDLDSSQADMQNSFSLLYRRTEPVRKHCRMQCLLDHQDTLWQDPRIQNECFAWPQSPRINALFTIGCSLSSYWRKWRQQKSYNRFHQYSVCWLQSSDLAVPETK